MGDLQIFPGITPLGCDPDALLKVAQDKLESVVIIGFDKDGDLFFSSSESDGGAVLWLMELAKKELLEVDL